MSERADELRRIIKSGDAEEQIEASQLVEEIIFIEENLKALRKLPFIRINPNNPEQQKATAAAKQYKELLQQYNNSLKLLLHITKGDIDSTEESPLRRWVNGRKEV